MPAVGDKAIRVRGYKELSRAFAKADRSIKGEVQDALRDVAEPIRSDAQARAEGTISNIGHRWGLMRTGLTTTRLYVAPRERGKRSRLNRALGRPNLAALLVDKAMQPALDAHESEVEHRFDEVLARIERIWDTAPGG